MNACDEILGSGLRRAGTDGIALICGDATLTYGELEALTNRAGNALRGAGIGRGDRVLLLLPDTPDFVAVWLAAVKIGAVAVAVNVRAAAKDLAYMVQDSGCRGLFVHDEFLDLWRAAQGLCRHRPDAVVTDVAAFTAGAAETLDAADCAPEDPAFWLYTSGTTGSPKGAIHLHRDVLIGDLHLVRNLGVAPGERLFASSKLFFAFSLGHCLIAGLRAGAAVILYDGWPDAAAVAEVVARHRPQVMFSVPTFYRNLLRDGLAASEAFRAVRHYVSAGEKLPETLHEQWIALTGKPVLEGIGTTETVFLMIANTPAAWRVGSTGRPMPWAELRLLDDLDQPVTAPGVPGLLWVRMGSVCAGYWNQPAKTAEAFRDGWYRTGDMFSVDAEGWWHYHGRGDDMLKISGQWVSPAEIEEAALAAGGVGEAAALGLENSDGLVRLALFLVPAPGSTEPEDHLAERVQQSIRARLSIYKCPRTIRVVDELPRTATGKVQRYVLKQYLTG